MLNNIFTDSLKEQARRFQDPVQHMAQAMVSSLERVTEFSLNTARSYADLGLKQLHALTEIKDAESLSSFQSSQAKLLGELNQLLLKDAERLTELGAQLRNDLVSATSTVFQASEPQAETKSTEKAAAKPAKA